MASAPPTTVATTTAAPASATGRRRHQTVGRPADSGVSGRVDTLGGIL